MTENVYSKWLEIVRQVGYVQKTGVNSYHKYTYVKESDLLDAIRPKMAEVGLVMFPAETEVISIENSITTIKFTYRVVDTSTGEFFDIQSIGQGADSQDKGAYKAATGALKYALRQGTMTSTGDDPEEDNDSYDDAKNPHAAMTVQRLNSAGIGGRIPYIEKFIGVSIRSIPNTDEGTALMRSLFNVANNYKSGADLDALLSKYIKQE